MRLRWLVLTVVVVLAVGVVATGTSQAPGDAVDLVAANDVVQTLAASPTLPPAVLPRGSDDYALLALDGHVLAATGDGLATSLTDAYRRGDTVVDVERDDADGQPRVVARVAFRAVTTVDQAAWSRQVRLTAVGPLLVVGGIVLSLLWYLHRQVLRPFAAMRGFARRVAAGDLDAPLVMDRGNAFGAFTESFDLMRVELHRAREQARAADRSKKELVASLSHDLLTPVASIKALAEYLAATDPAARDGLGQITAKADQIDALVANMLDATLEDMERLVVQPVPLASTQLAELLRQADTHHLVGALEIPACLVMADPVRLAQVVDNVVANSVKYAGTPIDVRAWLDDAARTLTVVVADDGPGVDPADLPLLTRKYFRGGNAQGRPGAGLGLYLSGFVMEKMGGSLTCGPARQADGRPRGLAVTLVFALA